MAALAQDRAAFHASIAADHERNCLQAARNFMHGTYRPPLGMGSGGSEAAFASVKKFSENFTTCRVHPFYIRLSY